MASLLRQIVAGPRARHPEAGLDLCYVTDFIVATSGPSQTYPQRAYRNPLDRLVAFLDAKHGDNWAIWEFRAEGTGYPDSSVYGRIRHYPWPDHHPPPFRLIPMIMASMRDWLHGGTTTNADGEITEGNAIMGKEHGGGRNGARTRRVAVVHCKAGKGRSGTVSCSYLISECGWSAEDALRRFTERRMRPGFGNGVSIPSQVRWIGYVDRWARHGGKRYVDREIEIVEVHVWGLREGVKVEIEGFVDEGKKIRVLHTFRRGERVVVEGNAPSGGGITEAVQDFKGNNGLAGSDGASELQEEELKGVGNGLAAAAPDRTVTEPAGKQTDTARDKAKAKMPKLISQGKASTMESLNHLKAKSFAAGPPSTSSAASSRSQLSLSSKDAADSDKEPGGMAVILLPEKPVRVPTNDVNISVERRNKAQLGLTMVTAVGHAWFNAYFEGGGPENGGRAANNGVFEIEWDAMDGIKGSLRKGTRALDRLAIVWRAVGADSEKGPEKAPAAGAEPGTGTEAGGGEEIEEPAEGESVPQMQAADWKGGNDIEQEPERTRGLGLRVQSPDSASVSKASSVRSETLDGAGTDTDSLAGVRFCGPHGEEDAGAEMEGLEKRAAGMSVASEGEDKAEKRETETKVGQEVDVLENPDTASGTTVQGEAKLQ